MSWKTWMPQVRARSSAGETRTPWTRDASVRMTSDGTERRMLVWREPDLEEQGERR